MEHPTVLEKVKKILQSIPKANPPREKFIPRNKTEERYKKSTMPTTPLKN
jgi:hypothetical protein